MKLDEQDRVRNHAFWFLSGLFFGNTTHSDFSFKNRREQNARAKKGCIPYEKVCIHLPRRGKLMSRNYAVTNTPLFLRR